MSITFKVAYGTDQKVVKYANSTLVSEVLAQCIKKFRVPTSGEDHALLLPTLPNRPGKWLATDRTLEQSDVQANDIVEFRKKHAQLKIKLTDGTTKTLLVDTSIPTIEVCKFIGDKILIRNGEEFGIQMDKGDSLSHWLDPNKTLGEQGVTEDSHLIYKKKFFVDDAFISTDDPASIHLLYMEAHDAIVAGAYPCSLQEAILFAAFQCQFELRNYTPEQHHEGTLKLEKFLPPAYLKTKNVETAVFKEHKKLSGMTEVNAKFRYIQLCRSLKTYGMSLFKIQVPKTSNNKKLVDKFLGITKQGLFLLDGKTKAIEKEYPLDHLRRWSHTETTFTLDFGTYEDDYLNCFTSQGEAINNLISGYIDLILKKLQSQGPGGGLVDGASGTAEISADLVDRPAVKKGVVNTSSFVARTEESYSPTFYTSARRAGRPTASASQPAIVQELSAAVLSINRLLDESDKEEASKTEEGGEGEGKAPRKDTGESGFQTDSQELAAIPESEKEAVRTQIAQNVTVMNEAVAKLLGPLAHASVLSSPEILDLHKQYAPQVATMVESILAISKGTKGITTKARAAMLSSAKNIAATMSNFLLATQEASSNPNDPITRENVFKYSTQIVPSLVLMEAISRGTTIGDVDPRVIDLAHQTAKPATALQEALARVIEKYESPVLKAHAQLLAAQLSNTDRQLRELTEGFAPFLEDPAVKKTLFDTLKIYNANLNYLEQIASIESVEGAEAIRFTITDLKGALNSLSIHAVGAEIEPPKVEKAPEPEKVPEPVVEEDNTDKMIQDELESATKAIRELGETLRETQHLRRQTIKFKPGKVVDPKQLEKELLTEELGEGILDATKNIAGASEKLMLIAIGLQKELVAAGRAGKSQNLYKKDPAWAQGLISASQTVTFTIRQLVVAAQAASRGDDVDEERLQVLASNVNAAAIRLVTSAKVKAVPGSQFVSQLGDATKAVSSSTGHLLEKAKKPAALVELVKEEKKQSELSMTSKAVREIEVQTQILKLRKALEEAQVELANLRKEDYSGSAPAPAPAPAPTRNIRKLSVPPQLLQQQQQQQQQQHQQYQQHDSSAPRKVSNPPTAQASGNRPPLRKASSPNPPAATPTPATPTPTPAPVDTPVPLPTADTTPAPPAESTQPTTTSETPELESESAQPPVDATVAENSSTTEHESLPEVGDYDLLSEKLAQLQTSEPTDSTETTESIESTEVPPTTTSSSSEPEVTPPPAAAPTTTTNTTEDEVGTTPPPTDT